MRSLAPLASGLVALVMLSTGCGGGTHGGDNCDARTGVVLLSWTVIGKPPTADQGCKGIDHLAVELISSCNDVEIEPIPCTNGERWRYDTLPGGQSFVNLVAVDSRQHAVARGSAVVQLDSSVPAQPTAIELQ
jgi:hypothetical protein